jgi:hypothetical protein
LIEPFPAATSIIPVKESVQDRHGKTSITAEKPATRKRETGFFCV